MVGGSMLPLNYCGRSHWPITTVAFWTPGHTSHLHSHRLHSPQISATRMLRIFHCHN